MKISSKSILSPGRAAGAGGGRDPPNSLSTSLSRRLRNSGSIKGGASPAMFPTTAKKRGSFENPEPSSPKVTCIGQVRVKTKKKQAKKLRTLSRRHSSGEVSFRKLEQCWPAAPEPVPEQRSNQKWVHFPVTICDALRAFGSEFSCLFPCRTEREKEEKMVAAENDRSSCGAVFARWLVAVQDGGGDGRRDIELVVEDVEEVEEEEEESFKKPRRHVFEDLEIINDRIEGHKDESRMSICIPPKNALLLMRCRSDPMKLEALTTLRSWEPTIDEEQDQDQEIIVESQKDLQMEHQPIMGLDQDQENQQLDDLQQDNQENLQENQESLQENQENLKENQESLQQKQESLQENQENLQEILQEEVDQDQEHDNVEQDKVVEDQEQEEVVEDQEQEESMYLGFLFEEIVNQDDDEMIQEHEVDSEMEEAREEDEASTMATEFAEISETHEEEMVNNGVLVLEKESEVKEEKEEVLPECLLMMMYEPKLSMEVSKETWVCSTDFIKRQSNKRKPPQPPPPPAVVKHDGGDESRVSVTINTTTNDYDLMRVADGGHAPVLQHPARSSCSFPAPPSMAAMLEQKLADAMGYEPFVLTRCKSEPMKTAAAKLLPESCVWENRKSKRLSGVGFGVGAAGLGF